MGEVTQDPIGGRIERDIGGRPTGILRETALDLVSSAVPEPQGEQADEDGFPAQQEVAEGPRRLVSNGIARGLLHFDAPASKRASGRMILPVWRSARAFTMTAARMPYLTFDASRSKRKGTS